MHWSMLYCGIIKLLKLLLKHKTDTLGLIFPSQFHYGGERVSFGKDNARGVARNAEAKARFDRQHVICGRHASFAHDIALLCLQG